MSKDELLMLIEPLSQESKKALFELLSSDKDLITEQEHQWEQFMKEIAAQPSPPLPQAEITADNEDNWLEQHQAAIRAVIEAHPEKKLPSNLSTTLKELKRTRLVRHSQL